MAEKNARDNTARSRQYTWLWMILSIFVIGGFLAWLGAESEPTQIQVVETDEDEEEAGYTDAELLATFVELEEFSSSPRQYADTNVRLEGVPVTSEVGPGAFWTDLPSEEGQGLTVAYLVGVSEQLYASGFDFEYGDSLIVTGFVRDMTDSVLDEWAAAGRINEDQRADAAFARMFLEISTARRIGGDDDDEEEQDEQ